MTVVAALLASLSFSVHALTFRAPDLAAPRIVALDPPAEKHAPALDASGRLRIGEVRGLAKAVAIPQWRPVAGGWVSRFSVSSGDAEGLRTRLDLSELPGPVEVRVTGADGTVETTPLDPRDGPEAWTAWTDGGAQVLEVFSPVEPWPGAIKVGALVHLEDSPLIAKAGAGSCTVPVVCTTNDAALDAAIAVAKKSMMRIVFNDDGSAYVCTATLIDTPQHGAAYVMTANHCIGTPEVAKTITTLWFYENTACDVASPVAATRTQVSGGMALVFGNHNVDSTLLLMNNVPPAGAVFAPVNKVELNEGQAIVSISHPAGDTARLALGNVTQQYRLTERPQNFNGVKFTRGIIEGGSSGSGLFTLINGVLTFRGTLLGTTVTNAEGGMSCTDPDEEAIYSRFDIFAPEIASYIGGSAPVADDAPNRPIDLFGLAATPLDAGSSLSRDGLRIDYAGDLDTFKVILASRAVLSAWSEGAGGANLDTVGAILDSSGGSIASNDDAQIGSNHFGVSAALDAGTYYVQVGHYDAGGTGTYNLRARAESVDKINYTDLWGNGAEPGWGINIAHQGNIIFASLYTYDANGAPLWLIMSNGMRQADGSYEGELDRYTGSAYNAPWFASTPRAVGTMKLVFTSPTAATVQYSVDGVAVSKTMSRFVFKEPVSCAWSAFDRSFADNFQDLWLDAAEPGWGLNIAHQKDTVFVTLFTYDAQGDPLWLYMSSGSLLSFAKYTGTLYRATGPVFNASPWVPAVSTAVGDMTLDFTDPDPNIVARGNRGKVTYTVNGVTVTKPIQRFEFGTLKPDCSAQ